MSDSRSAQLWSLWDMVANFSVSVSIWLVTELNLLIRIAAHNKELEAQLTPAQMADDPKSEDAMSQALESVTRAGASVESHEELMKSGHVKHALQRLRHWADNEDRTWAELFTRGCALRDAVEIEFRAHFFYAYPKDRGEKLKAWQGDWFAVLAAFPVNFEAFSATDCYALGHYTASVFHSMRVAEVGLRALAAERRIKLPRDKPVEWGTWQEIIKALNDEIRVIGQTWKAGKRKDAALEFYSGASADLNGFKDEFRNLVMHLRVQYDEFQAARALDRVHDFMERLSVKIDHKHHRIKWGQS